eukprot:GGOE01011177.1.p1 GENE.GGOE01011177.1~~GGOE01011177.1.p1  ORF type:complete len:1003 (-),score=268.62 GGOE01011177.1:1210-3858(-)
MNEVVNTFVDLMDSVVTDFRDVATDYAAELRAALAGKASITLQQTITARVAGLKRLQTLSSMGMVNLSRGPSDPIGLDDCSLLGVLCAAALEMVSTQPVTVALATGRSYSCTVGVEASISVLSLDGTNYSKQLLKWIPDSTSATVTRQRCLGPPASNLTVGWNCSQSQICGCGQDQRCTLWYQHHEADVGPSLSQFDVFPQTSGALATSISYSLFSTDSAPTLLAVASNNLELAAINRYLNSLLIVNSTVLAHILNDTNLSVVGNTAIACTANETVPGDPSLPIWSGLRSCNSGIRNVTQWLSQNRSGVHGPVSLQLSDVSWDIFPTNISILSYFLVIGSPLSVINAAADASNTRASNHLTTVRAQQLDRVTASGIATKKYLSTVTEQYTVVSQQMETSFLTQMDELQSTSKAELNATQQRSASQTQQLMSSLTTQIEDLTSKFLNAMTLATGWTIAVVFGFLLIVLVCSGWGTVFVTHDLTSIIGLMEDVADMKVEDLTVQRNSHVTEVARIETAFQVLVRRLAEYKSYIPAGVFEKMTEEGRRDDGHNESDRDVASDAGSQISCAKPTAKQQRRSQPDVSCVTTMQRSVSSESRSIASSPAGPCSSMKSRAAVLSFRAFDFTEALLQMAPLLAKNMMSQCISHIHEAASQSHGNIDCILGDQILITFNAHVPCAEPAAAAVAAALEMRRLLLHVARERLKFQIGISYGPVLAGSVGYSKFRSMAALGLPIKVSSMVSQMSEFENGTVLVDANVEEKMKYIYDLRPVELVHFPQLRPMARNTPTCGWVFLVEAKREVEEDEWLYQVDTMSPKRDDWRQVFGRVMAAQTVEEGRGHLEEFLATHPQDAIALRLRDCLPMWTPGLGLPLWDRAHHDDGHTLCP